MLAMSMSVGGLSALALSRTRGTHAGLVGELVEPVLHLCGHSHGEDRSVVARGDAPRGWRLIFSEPPPPGAGLGEVFGSGESGLDALSVHDAAGRGEAVAVVAAGAGVSGDEVPVGATS